MLGRGDNEEGWSCDIPTLLSQLSVALVTTKIIAIPPKNAPNFLHFSHPML